MLAITTAAARIDADVAAAHQILFQTFILLAFLMDGFAVAGQTLVGNALGAGDEDEARAVGREMLRWGIGGGAVIAALLLLGSGIVPRLLTDDPAVLATVAGAWWLAALGQLVNGPAFTLDGVLMGAEDYAYLRTWTMIAGLVGGVAGQTVAALGGGILGLWVAVQAMMAVRLLSLVVRLYGRGWTGTAGRVQPS